MKRPPGQRPSLKNALQRNRDHSYPRSRQDVQDIQVELTRLLFRNLGGTVLLGGGGLVGTSALLAQHFADPFLLRMTFIAAFICTMRLAVVIAFNASPRPDLTPTAATRWESVYGLFTFLYCTSLGVATFYNFRHHDTVAQSLCTIGTFIISAALSARIGMRPWISQLCCIMMLGSLAISVCHLNDALSRTGLVLLCFFAYTNWEGSISKFRIVVEQLRSRRTLQHLADQDALTGLANRRRFEDTLADLCGQAGIFGILYMDLDRFKQVNDTHGHLVGDALLKCVADRLRKVVRQEDLLARLGGDEFAIIQTHIVNDDAPKILAGRIQHSLSHPILIEGHEICISASIGARLSEGTPTTPRVLIGCADAALYRVKQAGGASFALAKD